jgi:hypothetical protein
MRKWDCKFDGSTHLWIRTLWFGVEFAVEAVAWDTSTVWWGVRFCYGRNPHLREGERFFLQERKIVFHEISYYQKVWVDFGN